MSEVSAERASLQAWTQSRRRCSVRALPSFLSMRAEMRSRSSLTFSRLFSLRWRFNSEISALIWCAAQQVGAPAFQVAAQGKSRVERELPAMVKRIDVVQPGPQ